MSKGPIWAVASLAVAALTACSSDEGGTALPVGSSSEAPNTGTASSEAVPTSVPGTAPTGSLDPCTLLSESDIAKYGDFQEPQRDTRGGARACDWLSVRGAAESIGIGISIRDNDGVQDAQDQGLGIDTAQANGRDLARIPTPDGGCLLAIGVGESSRVDVNVGASDNRESCEIADELAGVVEPMLPEG